MAMPCINHAFERPHSLFPNDEVIRLDMDLDSQSHPLSSDDESAQRTDPRPNEATGETLKEMAKKHGAIEGIPIFSVWEDRAGLSAAAVHRPLTAGIHGNRHDGVFSIVLSNLYEDKDDGDTITYTGAGGLKKESDDLPPKILRPGPNTPQICDQTWEHTSNRALMVSRRSGNLIRVIRGSKCVSRYAPTSGFRYDGLYRIVDTWEEKGESGFNICCCRLVREPGQPPIPVTVR